MPCLFVCLFAWKTYQIIRMLSSGGYIGVRTLNTALLFDLLFCPKREIQTLYLLGIDIYTLYSIILLYRSVWSLYAYSVLESLLRLGGIFQNLCCDRWRVETWGSVALGGVFSVDPLPIIFSVVI